MTGTTPTISAISGLTPAWLGHPLGADVRSSLRTGITAGVAFEAAGAVVDQFRGAVRRAITAIEAKDAGGLLPRFLMLGPYIDTGPVPRERRHEFLNDAEVAAAIRFIHSSAINSFQGALAEMLAVASVCELAARLAPGARVFAGDSVLARKPRRAEWGKAADFHVLQMDESRARVLGVAEVKSYVRTPDQLRPQLDQHVRRPRRGLRILGRELAARCVDVGSRGTPAVRICVVPANWRLSREVRFETVDRRSVLVQPPAVPPEASDRIEQVGARTWLVTLRWSQEALASAAYDMTFWYMGILGEMLWAQARPKGWERATPEEAGQNAAKMMLYYSILRARNVREESRAVALYNAYSFGYSLGANFVDCSGRRRMLWPEDLHEIGGSSHASGHGRGWARTKPVPVKDKLGRVRKTLPALFCRIRD